MQTLLSLMLLILMVGPADAQQRRCQTRNYPQPGHYVPATSQWRQLPDYSRVSSPTWVPGPAIIRNPFYKPE